MFSLLFSRFAMAEMKITLAKLLRAFRISATEETKLDCFFLKNIDISRETKTVNIFNSRLDFYDGDLFFLSYPEVRVKLEKRF